MIIRKSIFLYDVSAYNKALCQEFCCKDVPGLLSLSPIFLLFLAVGIETATAKVIPDLSDEKLLDQIQQKAVDYFVVERSPKSGLIRDKVSNFQRSVGKAPASIAATGFGLAAYGVGVERGWLDQATAYRMTYQPLQFFLRLAAEEHGFFYHFLDMDTGERWGHSELSPIDTAFFLAGSLFAAEYFNEPPLRDLVRQIYERVDWPWMLHGGKTLALAWLPENGFEKRRWDHYNESMIMYLLAIGSPTHPIPASSWQAIRRPVGSYRGYRLIQMPPLFAHQYSHIWIDFRGKNDGFADYFQDSVNATLANRAFCIDQSSHYITYGPNVWGLTASEGPFGYRVYGAPPGWASHDGTIAPTGCGSAIVFTPEASLACLRSIYENYGDQLWGRYGLADAFNLDKNWVAQDVLGIDQGALLLMIENYRSGLIWKVMERSRPLMRAMKEVGFRPGTKELPWPDPPRYLAPYLAGGIQVDGYLKDWPHGERIVLDATSTEFGEVEDDKDLKGEIRFVWDRDALYFAASVTDQDVVVHNTARDIWRDDLFELYVDPQGDGLYWDGHEDFQIGFRPHRKNDAVEVWSWFQGGDNPSEEGMILAAGYVHETGYVIEGAIRWHYFDLLPEGGQILNLSVALHDIDRDHSEGKLQWFFRNEEEFQRFVLGQVVLE